MDTHLSLTRGVARDTDAEGIEAAMQLYQNRYRVAEAIYVAEVDPRTIADVIIDNTDFANPRLLHTRPAG